MVKVKVDGIFLVVTDSDVVAARATGAGMASGLGDVAVTAKLPASSSLARNSQIPAGWRSCSSRGCRPATGGFNGLGIVRSLGWMTFLIRERRVRPHAMAVSMVEEGLIISHCDAQVSSSSSSASISVPPRDWTCRGRTKLTLNVDILARPHPR